MKLCYDVCIVGAGPHALAVLSALQTPTARLSEQEHKRKWRLQAGSDGPSLKVLVVDPSGEFLYEWNKRFAALGIDFLRSPSWAHPDAFSQESLVDFARLEGRLAELRDVDLSGTKLQGMPEIEAWYFSMPGTKLFQDFCNGRTP